MQRPLRSCCVLLCVGPDLPLRWILAAAPRRRTEGNCRRCKYMIQIMCETGALPDWRWPLTAPRHRGNGTLNPKLSCCHGVTLQGVIAVEGLNLDELEPGLHNLHCLPGACLAAPLADDAFDANHG